MSLFKSAYFRRLFLPYLMLICGAMLIVGLLSARRLRATYLERTAHGMRDNALLVAQSIEPALRSNDNAKLAEQIRSFGHTLGCRLTVIVSDGTVIADNEADPQHMENHRYREEVVDTLAHGQGVSVRHSHTIDENMLYCAQRIQLDQSTYVLRLAVPLRDLDHQLASLYSGLALTGVLATVIAGIVCYIFTRRHTVPVVELTAFADAIAHGDLSRRIVRESEGEIGTLGNALNSMADSLGRLIEVTNQDKAELLAMLSSMSEGVLAIDADQRIVVSNAAARRLFDLEDPDIQGRFLWEIVRHPAILQAAEQALQSCAQKTFQIGPIARRHLQVTACPIRHADARSGLVIVASDATETVRYEELRKEFVANVSHELRTPLTAIKGFAETLREFGQDDPGRYLQHLAVIEKNADQLTNLVNDLLELSRLDSSPDAAHRRPLDLCELVRHAVELLTPLARRKEQEIHVELDLELPSIEGVADYLERAVCNLIDNAIKYTPAGGNIQVATRAEGDFALIEVTDTGIGIPPGEVSRIFERFYRVDRSRSREMGGTGLGLSIVKHVVQSHHGTVEAASTLGRGSTFTVKLPLRRRSSEPPLPSLAK
ncbi:ATP-binding protein [soil metagenome]